MTTKEIDVLIWLAGLYQLFLSLFFPDYLKLIFFFIPFIYLSRKITLIALSFRGKNPQYGVIFTFIDFTPDSLSGICYPRKIV